MSKTELDALLGEYLDRDAMNELSRLSPEAVVMTTRWRRRIGARRLIVAEIGEQGLSDAINHIRRLEAR
jgi:hypothetical protein